MDVRKWKNMITEITEDFCSLDVAKLLKEKGFDVPCNACWYLTIVEKKPSIHVSYYVYDYNGDDEYRRNELPLSAPTYQMVMKWLREVHNLWCEISWEGKGLWCMEVFSLMDEEFIPGSIIHEIKSYEEACETAIKYCLTNLI